MKWDCWRLVRLAGFLPLVLFPVTGYADTVHLKNGKTIEGDVVRKDDTQVVVLVNTQPQFFSADEVQGISYSRLRFTPPSAPTSPARSSGEPVRIDVTLLQQVAVRVQTAHERVKQLGQVLGSLQRHEDQAAIEDVHQIVEGILPIQQGRFNPLYALADLLVLLALRAPTVWLGLLLVRESRPFTRIAEFLTVAYGLTTLLMLVASGIANLWVKILILPLTLVGVLGLFAWMFVLPFRKALIAFLLIVGMSLGIGHLLLGIPGI